MKVRAGGGEGEQTMAFLQGWAGEAHCNQPHYVHVACTRSHHGAYMQRHYVKAVLSAQSVGRVNKSWCIRTKQRQLSAMS